MFKSPKRAPVYFFLCLLIRSLDKSQMTKKLFSIIFRSSRCTGDDTGTGDADAGDGVVPAENVTTTTTTTTTTPFPGYEARCYCPGDPLYAQRFRTFIKFNVLIETNDQGRIV